MNTIQGQQWFAAGAFRRYALLAHPLFVDAKGAKPQLHTGRFARRDDAVLAFYRSDFDAGRCRLPPQLAQLLTGLLEKQLMLVQLVLNKYVRVVLRSLVNDSVITIEKLYNFIKLIL